MSANKEVDLMLSQCHPYLRERIPKVQALYQEIMGRDLFMTCTFRPVGIQQVLYAKGRTAPGEPCWHAGQMRAVGTCETHPLGLAVTWVDGVNKKSNHNITLLDGTPWARAVDFCVDLDTSAKVKPTWNEAFYYPLPYICNQVGLISGGTWSEQRRDWPHCEVPIGVD